MTPTRLDAIEADLTADNYPSLYIGRQDALYLVRLSRAGLRLREAAEGVIADGWYPSRLEAAMKAFRAAEEEK